MLRSSLIYLSKAQWAKKAVMSWNFAWKAASRFIAGETLDDAISVVKTLNSKGINATLDHLGEHTHTSDDATKATRAIMDIVDGIFDTGIRSNVSLKLTQIGLAVDENICQENLCQIIQYAQSQQIFVRIDMEDSTWVDTTLRLYRKMRELKLDNCGLVIQSYLYRSEADIRALCDQRTPIRLCKGAYKEPPEVAFPKKKDVDQNFDLLAKIIIDNAFKVGSPLLSADGRTPPIPAIGSHDPVRVENAKQYAAAVGLPIQGIEFQMLYGIRRELQLSLVQEGYPVRVYVPYGTEWYPYYVRRLAERPANVWFFISNFFRN